MGFAVAEDTEAIALRTELDERAMSTDVDGLMTANVWLWVAEQPDADPRTVVSALLAHPALPAREWLAPSAACGPWVGLTAEVATDAAVRLLTCGQSLEIPAFQHEPQAASQFAARLFAWVGRPVVAFGSMEHRSGGVSKGFSVFQVPHWFDEGLVLVGPERAAMLWFVGTD